MPSENLVLFRVHISDWFSVAVLGEEGALLGLDMEFDHPTHGHFVNFLGPPNKALPMLRRVMEELEVMAPHA